jgi:putative tricarboxylic transport membrane protein
MRWLDRVSAIFCLLFSVFVGIESYRLDLGRLSNPGPGLMPFCGAVLLAFFSSVILIRAIQRVMGDKEIGESLAAKIRWGKLILTLLALFGYALSMEWLGLPLTTLVFTGFLLKVIEPQKWSVIISGSILTTGGVYLLFKVFLKVPLPPGFLGI